MSDEADIVRDGIQANRPGDLPGGASGPGAPQRSASHSNAPQLSAPRGPAFGSSLSLGHDPELRDRLRRLLPAGDLSEAPAGALLASANPDPSPEYADELLARVVWSRLVEPGDAVAGRLIAELGARPLLDLLTAGATASQVAAHVSSGGTEIAEVKEISAALQRWHPRLSQTDTRADLDRGIAAGMRLLTPDDPRWPLALNDLGPHAPLLLWLRGDPALLTEPGLAIVGARACTGYGSHVTAELASAASSAGVTVVSGAAYGIDAVAHRAALAAGAPTVAVLAGGVDRPYPSAHKALLDRVADQGVVCSELVPGSAPTRWRFLQRNRVIAALTRATLVTEAGLRSGSLNTAGHAAELGRVLGAVPGPITSAASAGCHRLLREYGASLVSSAAELEELLGIQGEAALFSDTGVHSRAPALHSRVLDALPLRGSRGTSEVARRAGVSLGEARGALAELELLSSVARVEAPDSSEAQWGLRRRR